MNFAMPNFMLAAPEMLVLSMACLILVIDVFLAERNRAVSYTLAQLTLIAAAVITASQLDANSHVSFGGSFVSDPLSGLLKLFIYLVTAGGFLYSRDYLRARNLFKGEFYVLGLFAVLGMMVMVSAHSLLTIYLGLELMSLSLYALVAFDRDSARASEAAMKYFVLGALASGMLLYGMSMLYGASGSLDIAAIGMHVRHHAGMDLVLVLGLVFVSVGVAFKLGAVPFHMWLPDVYHGASAPVTLFVGTAPKIAAFAMAMRLFTLALGNLYGEWRDLLIVLVLLSLALGNIVAIAQTNLKRMLAYSAISHVGFLLLGVLAGTAAVDRDRARRVGAAPVVDASACSHARRRRGARSLRARALPHRVSNEPGIRGPSADRTARLCECNRNPRGDGDHSFARAGGAGGVATDPRSRRCARSAALARALPDRQSRFLACACHRARDGGGAHP